jgi:hypothetical protein
MGHLQNIYKYRVLRDQGHPFFTFTCVEDLFWCSGNCNRSSNPRLVGFGPQTDGFGELESFSVEAIANDSYLFLHYFKDSPMLKFASNRSSLAVYLLTCAGCLTSGASAGWGVVEATGAFQLPGGSTTTYVSEVGGDGNPRIQGYNFGSVNTLTGQTLLLQNFYFENYAYNGGAGNNNWLDGSSTATLNVLIQQGSTQISSTNYALQQTSTSGNNRFWNMATGTNTNLAAGLASAAYTVAFNVTYTYNIWNGSQSVGTYLTGASIGTFTILPVPAPGAFALLGLAGFIGARRRST